MQAGKVTGLKGQDARRSEPATSDVSWNEAGGILLLLIAGLKRTG